MSRFNRLATKAVSSLNALFCIAIVAWLLGWGLALPNPAQAQSDAPPAENHAPSPVSIEFGADVVSRYVWRGIGFGASPSLQPSIAVQAYGVQLGTWGNYALSPDGSNPAEHDFWLGYTLDLGPSRLTLSLNDYYYPGASQPFFDWEGGGKGSHTLEASVRYLVSPDVPAHVLLARNVHNDPDGSWYVEAGYTAQVRDVETTFSTGLTRGQSVWYGVAKDQLAVLNVQLRLAKTVPLTERFALPMSAALVVNPYAEQTHLVFGLTL